MFQKVRRLPKGEARTEAFRTARRSVAFTDAALQRYAVRLRQQVFREHLDVYVAQKLAFCAFAAVNAWLLDQRGRPRFKGFRQLDAVDGQVEWLGISLPAFLDPRDPGIAHALGGRVKYVRLVRRKKCHPERQ